MDIETNQQIARIAAASYCRFNATQYEDTSQPYSSYKYIANEFENGDIEQAKKELFKLEKDLAKKGQLK